AVYMLVIECARMCPLRPASLIAPAGVDLQEKRVLGDALAEPVSPREPQDRPLVGARYDFGVKLVDEAPQFMRIDLQRDERKERRGVVLLGRPIFDGLLGTGS